MKFGERGAVEHFARLLAPLALKLITGPRRDWILTSPPVRSLPSGANLMCEAIHRILRDTLPEDRAPALEPLCLTEPADPFVNEDEFRTYGDYAQLDYSTRQDCQIDSDEDVEFDRERFRGREVVFVNDINVTGSQMRRIEGLLKGAAPRNIHWLLIANTLEHIGRQFPELESEINHSRFARREEFVSLLRDADLRYTGKLVARLFSFGNGGLARIFQSLDTATRRAIRHAIEADGMYASDFFREKVAAAEGAC